MAVLTGDGLCLRPLLLADAPALTRAALESVTTVGVWLPWCDASFKLEDAVHWVQTCDADRAEGSAFSVGIFDAGDGDYLGGIGINHINREHDFANLGFWVRQSRHGERIAPRAARLMAAYGFSKLGLTRLEIVAAGIATPRMTRRLCRMPSKRAPAFSATLRLRAFCSAATISSRVRPSLAKP